MPDPNLQDVVSMHIGAKEIPNVITLAVKPADKEKLFNSMVAYLDSDNLVVISAGLTSDTVYVAVKRGTAHQYHMAALLRKIGDTKLSAENVRLDVIMYAVTLFRNIESVPYL